jgi:hypothetical protein
MRNLPREGEEIIPWNSLESHQSHPSIVPGGGHLKVEVITVELNERCQVITLGEGGG